MLNQNSYVYIARSSEEVPEKVVQHIRQEIVSALGGPVSKVFPAFSQAFPLTVESMEKHWGKPVAAFKEVVGQWLSYLLLERQDQNLFFDLRYAGYPIAGPDYERDHAMLPSRWRELYRFFESFAITADSQKTPRWNNTPFTYSGRLTLEEYRQRNGLKKSKVRDFSQKVNSDNLMCWMISDAGDALFLDEARCDHKVYHVKDDAFEDLFVLPDPGATLDQYLAHVVSGKSPHEFNFRAWK